VRFWRPATKRCQKCNAIATPGDSHCHRCGGKRFVAGKVIVLPHMADGTPRKFGETCGAKR
jgi:hypothetical protein